MSSNLEVMVNEVIRLYLIQRNLGTVNISNGTITTLTTTNVTISDGNIALGTSTGTQIGTAANQLLGFHGATPSAQGAAISDAAGGTTIDTEARTAINALLARMRTKGLIAT